MKHKQAWIARHIIVVVLTSILIWEVPVYSRPAAVSAVLQPNDLPSCPRWSYSKLTASPFFEEDRTLFLTEGTNPQVSGLWRSIDGGEHWDVVLRLQDWYDHAAIGQVSIAPTGSAHGLTVYARTMFVYYGNRVYALLRSINDGRTWSVHRMCDESLAYCRNWVKYVLTNMSDVWFVPRVESYLYDEADIQRWEEGGYYPFSTVWDETGATDLSVSPNYAADHLVYASLWPASPTLQTKLIRSSDGGDTWQNGSTEGLCPGEIAAIRFSPTFASDRTIFALQDGAVFKSVNAGNSWRLIYPLDGVACQIPEPVFAANNLQVSPHYSQDATLYVTTTHHDPFESYLYVSSDGGTSWQVLLRFSGDIDNLVVTAIPSARTKATPVFPVVSQDIPNIEDVGEPVSLIESKLFFPLVGVRGPEPIPLTVFLTRLEPGTGNGYHYRSDDGGVTWRCLALPPENG